MDHDLIAEWFQFADTDLASAEHLSNNMRPQPLEIICYHSQQAAEKYLKGYLIFKGIMEPPKTHKLNNLIDICAEYDERFNEIEQACSALTRYGVQPRYPKEIRVTVNDALKALEYARQVRDFDLLVAVRKEVEKT